MRKTPYGQVLKVQTTGLHAPSIETDIVLFDNEKKVEFINRFHKEPVHNKEAVYFAFPFAVEKPSFSYEIQNGWVDPHRDVLKGGNLAWFTAQHWVKVAGPDVAIGLVPLDAPLVTFGDISRGTWPEKFEPNNATVFSYAINNYWWTGVRQVQSGDFTFRYALTSDRDLSPDFLARFGRATMTPFELGQLTSIFGEDKDKFGNPERPLTPAPTSFLRVDSPNVLVENWKVAEDGRGTIIRLLEVGGRSGTAQLSFPLFELQHAWLANAVEEDLQDLEVSSHELRVTLKPHEILTVRIVALKISP